jgi:hypothetical protein
MVRRADERSAIRHRKPRIGTIGDAESCVGGWRCAYPPYGSFANPGGMNDAGHYRIRHTSVALTA